MKTLPAGFTDHLAGGATTLAWCWRLTRADGVRLGFTDHDRDITFEATTFEAASGFAASEIKDQVGLGVDNLEVSGAVASGLLAEDDLAQGLYDDARVEIFRVNWQAPDQRVLMRAGSLGEVRRAGKAFAAEVRGLAHYLQQPKGRLFQFACDADLGDGRCGVDLTAPALRGAGTVIAAESARGFRASGLDAYDDGWFTRGLATFTSGSNAGARIEVRLHRKSAAGVGIELWQPPAHPIAPGDAVTITAGCDKQLATCKARFANAVRFRGFPHMPGNDFVARFAGRSG